MIDKAQTADILRAAANKIREVGWTRGAALSNGRMCALGAIGSVTGCKVMVCGIFNETTPYLVATDALVDWLSTSGVWGSGSIVGWNDADPHRTMDDVVTGMEKAAAWIEEQA